MNWPDPPIYTVPGHASGAQQSGFSSTSGPSQVVMNCQPEPIQSYHPCDIATLSLALSYEGGSQSVSVSSKRRQEVVANSVPDGYRGYLRDHDVLVEALAPVEETKTTRSRSGSVKSEATKNHKPLKVSASAIPAMTCGPDHLEFSINGPALNETLKNASFTGDIFTPPPSSLLGASRWGRVWPFGEDLTQPHTLEGTCCGNNPNGTPIGDLKMKLMVMPDESWKITLGLGTYSSGSISAESARKTGPDKAQTGVVIARKRQIGNTSTERRETYIASTHYSDEFSVFETSGVLRRHTDKLAESDSTWGAPGFEEAESDKTRQIKIEHVVGGVKSEVDASKVIDGVLRALDTIEDLGKLFDGIPKIGWSVSASFSFLKGSASLEWGHRWPTNYVEQDRVYYVERFIKVGGNVDLAAGNVEVFFGVEIDPWWLDIYFVAKLYVNVSAKVSISPQASVTATNFSGLDLDLKPIDLDCAASAKAELGATTGGRAFGYEVIAKLALESSVKFDVDGKISRKGPEAKASLSSTGAHIIGEIVVVGRRRKTYDFKPIEVIKKKTFFKDKVIF